MRSRKIALLTRGMSLVEIVIAALILAMVAASVSRLVTFSSKTTVAGTNTTRATELINGIIEEIRKVEISRFQPTADVWTEISQANFPSYFPVAAREFETFREKTRNLSCRVLYKLEKNTIGQTREVWIKAEIDWTDLGSGQEAQPKLQSARSGMVIVNPEAM